MDVLNFPATPEMDDTIEVTERCFGGYHRCRLDRPYRLDYISDSLCKLLGYSAGEIYEMAQNIGPPKTRVARHIIYQPDLERLEHFLDELAETEQTRAIRLRMVKKDGTMIYVNETISSHRAEDGVMYGYAVVAELTRRQQELFSQQPMPAVVPYGYVQCSCDSAPQITSINDQMLEYLGYAPDQSARLIQQDLLFLIPNEERQTFLGYLEEAKDGRGPVNIEHQFVRADGRRITLMGWVNVMQLVSGKQSISFLYMLTDYKHSVHDSLSQSSLFYALKCAYSVILEHNLSTYTVSCVHGKDLLGPIYDTKMTIDSGRRFWLDNFVVAEDRETLETFLDRISTAPIVLDGQTPLDAKFHVNWTEGRHFYFRCVAVQLDDFRVLLCLQDIGSQTAAPQQTAVQEAQEASTGQQIFARTFGYFDLFVDGTPIVFSNSKEKELLALLIDRNGGTLTTDQAITYLWEDEPVDDHLYARYRKLAMGLKKTLMKYGIERILINHNGVRSIDTSTLKCDYYELLAGNEQYIKSFHNVYMTDYSWADDTLATLWDYS